MQNKVDCIIKFISISYTICYSRKPNVIKKEKDDKCDRMNIRFTKAFVLQILLSTLSSFWKYIVELS